MFDPTVFPYVRAQTYVDANPPEVLADEFFNPVQDGIARLYGADTGYSTSISYEEFEVNKALTVPVSGDLIGQELACISNPGGNFQYRSIAPGQPNMHGVIQIDGVGAGARGGAPGFEMGDAPRYIGTLRWIFCCRVRCSTFGTISTAPPGLVLGLGSLTSTHPSWIADGTGFWTTFWDGGATPTAIPTVDNEWVNLWIACKDGDGVVRWYLKRDTDPAPMLMDTQTLTTPLLVSVTRYVRILVTGGAVAADNVELDKISLGVER